MRMSRVPLTPSMYFKVGSAAVIRVSSPMTPSLIGTLKSTRTSTRLPERSMSRTVFLAMG